MMNFPGKRSVYKIKTIFEASIPHSFNDECLSCQTEYCHYHCKVIEKKGPFFSIVVIAGNGMSFRCNFWKLKLSILEYNRLFIIAMILWVLIVRSKSIKHY